MSSENLIFTGSEIDPVEESSQINQPVKKMGVPKVKVGIIFGIAVIAIAIGLTGVFMWDSIYKKIVKHELILSESSTSFSIWKKTPIPMYLEIYMFNWTNPTEFSKTIKPHFTEHGPYVFSEIDSKDKRIWNDNYTITFNQRKTWIFESALSNGTLDDKITNLNPVAATINYMVRNRENYMKIIANGVLKIIGEDLTVTKSVRQLLFDGYDDKLLTLATKTKLVHVPYDKFGWFYTRNDSLNYDGTFTMWTGEDDMNKIGVLSEWNYKNKSTIYPDTCSKINGSLGDLWPSLNNANTASVFAPDACTLVELRYNGTSEMEGLTGRKYISTPEMFDNGTNVPSRSCYCKNIDCQPSGLLNVSECKFGAPAFLSSPHFYQADKSYLEAVDGLNPLKEKHEFNIVIEPNNGIPLQVQARLQMNLLITPVDKIRIFEKLPKTFMPMLWFQQSAKLTSRYSTSIKFLIILPTLGYVTMFGIAGIGSLLLVIGSVIIVRAKRRSSENQKLIDQTENRNLHRNNE